MKKAVFVSHRNSVHGGAGGQQVCTHEYRETLRLAGFDLVDVLWEHERTLVRRVSNRLNPSPYNRPWPSDLARRAVDAARQHDAKLVFLNVIDLLPLAQDIKEIAGNDLKVVMLSHGLASVDEVHTQRILTTYPFLPINPSPLRPGELLRQEAEYLPPSVTMWFHWLHSRSKSVVGWARGRIHGFLGRSQGIRSNAALFRGAWARSGRWIIRQRWKPCGLCLRRCASAGPLM